MSNDFPSDNIVENLLQEIFSRKKYLVIQKPIKYYSTIINGKPLSKESAINRS